MRQFHESIAARSGGSTRTAESGFIAVGDGHELHYIRTGTQGGTPLVVCHGGPGAWMDSNYQELLENTGFDAIIYSQRGCGVSRRKGEPQKPEIENETNKLEHCVERALYVSAGNRIEDQIHDIEVLRKHFFGDRSIHLLGGSWGGALAMLYAIHYPKRVNHLVLRCTSLTELCGAMNPDNREVLEAQRLCNPAFAAFEAKIKELTGEAFDRARIFVHLYEGLHDRRKDGVRWTVAEKCEVALMWRYWNKMLQYSKMSFEQARAIVDANIEQNVRFSFLFSSLLRGYPDYGRAYFERELPWLYKASDCKITIIHGINDSICPLRNALDVFRWFAGEDVRGPIEAGVELLSRDKRAVLLPVHAGHASDDGGIWSALEQVIANLSQ